MSAHVLNIKEDPGACCGFFCCFSTGSLHCVCEWYGGLADRPCSAQIRFSHSRWGPYHFVISLMAIGRALLVLLRKAQTFSNSNDFWSLRHPSASWWAHQRCWWFSSGAPSFRCEGEFLGLHIHRRSWEKSGAWFCTLTSCNFECEKRFRSSDSFAWTHSCGIL